MLGSWRPSRKPPHPSLDRPAHPPTQGEGAGQTLSTRPSLDRAATTALSTPHDVVLSELLGRRRSASPEWSPVPDAPRQALPKISIDGTGSSFYREERTATPSAPPDLRSGSSTPHSSHEPLYDPFTGALAGVMASPAVSREDSHGMSDAEFDRTRDELWAHLARIREVQSEIAGMHLQMEGVGSGEARSARRATSAARRPTEEWEVPSEAEEQRKTARDAEFANLAETFRGRRAAIDGIMNKLDELSQALTTFHALSTPVMDFNSVRSGTKDSSPNTHDVPSSRPVQSAVLFHDNPERDPAFPESPLSDAPSHVADP